MLYPPNFCGSGLPLFSRLSECSPNPFDCGCLTSWEQVTVSVHRQSDVRMSHDRLHGLNVRPALDQPASTRVTQAMEIESLTF